MPVFVSASEVSRAAAVARAAELAGVPLAEYEALRAQGLKWCRGGGEWLPVAEFGSDVKRADGLTSSCRACGSARKRARPSAGAAKKTVQRPTTLAEVRGFPVPADPGPDPTGFASLSALEVGDAVGWPACSGEDPELFFPVGDSGPAVEQLRAAKAVCCGCPVRLQCLRWALDTGQDYGVWGGLSEDERRALRGMP